MKALTITLMAILSVPVLAAAEEATPKAAPNTAVDKWTCEEFLAIDEQFKPKAVYWASAHTKAGKKHKDKVLNIEGTEQVIPMVIDECTKAPKATFWQKLKSSWDKAEQNAKAEMKEIGSDLGDIKTNMINKTTK
jgi:acid stress chaperone HdeA